MKGKIIILCLAIIAIPLTSLCQDSWIMLEEYPSPGQGARGLYYAGKLLWNVDNESQTIFTLNPYNLEVVDIYDSPIDCPWGITVSRDCFWMTNFGWNTSQLVQLEEDTFAVAESWDFPGWYFYGLTCDTTNSHLWIAAMNHGYDYYLMEFDPFTCEVVDWHPWYGNWPLGMQYENDQLWVNSSTWNYPDFTYILDLDPWTIQDMLICPLSVPEGIATNGVVWWISHFRNDAPYIWKMVPPGNEVHDITWFSPHDPPCSGIIQNLLLSPVAQYLNYGMYAENEVPIRCQIWDATTDLLVYEDSASVGLMEPEEIVDVEFSPQLLEANMNYYVVFFSDLQTDDYRWNDTLKLDIQTVQGSSYHDVAPVEIISPEPCEPYGPISPAVVVENLGSYDESSFDIELTVSDEVSQVYYQRILCPPLVAGERIEIPFPTFNPAAAASYRFYFETLLAGDEISSNNSIEVTTDIVLAADQGGVPVIVEFRLTGMYPNPFNNQCSLHYELPQQADVRLDLFDLQGKQVYSRRYGEREPGQYCETFTAEGLASGIYIVSLNAGSQTINGKIVLLR